VVVVVAVAVVGAIGTTKRRRDLTLHILNSADPISEMEIHII